MAFIDLQVMLCTCPESPELTPRRVSSFDLLASKHASIKILDFLDKLFRHTVAISCHDDISCTTVYPCPRLMSVSR